MSATKRLQRHLRRTFLTGIFAAIPLAVTVAVIAYVEKASREPVAALLGINIPFIGIGVALVLIYLIGLIVSSIVGKLLLAWLDRLLLRVPVLRELYKAWKEISLTPGGREGIYGRVVLVPDGDQMILGFTSGDAIDGDAERICVYIPDTPNPMAGHLALIERSLCIDLGIPAEEAFKMILSGGNYVPPAIGKALGGELS
ncbi:MAG: DUF502 domain-containing protein [Myxococcales bacterium]|nr:DUF502 domain-containing protein [Myxococcales bacterium]MCB9565787.1 DUF502 domain-containing protein [Myxococcales bacterium]MCB9703026.1 DUF502 domain-containing protein [Myxococcales bacterium]